MKCNSKPKKKTLNTKNGTDVYKMGQINQKWDKILELIFEYSNQKFTIREISKKTKIPSSSVQRYIQELKNEGVLIKEGRANTNDYFKLKKTFFIIDKMHRLGLINYLVKELNPSVIIVFGSIRKGEYERDSDIDLFIESSVEKEIDLKKYEKLLNHKIQIFIENDINNLHSNLFNSIINGIKLFGSFKIK